ncbi:putative sulfate exporter family transporter [bacterium]|nr:putative sulfate exporter family transporter [bacterium]
MKIIVNYVFVIALIACVVFRLTSVEAMLIGAMGSLVLGNPFAGQIRRWTHHCLAISVVGLGAGMTVASVQSVGVKGLLLSGLMILVVLVAGAWLARWIQVGRVQSVLIAVGTAICGGSAIAAVAPVLDATDQELSVSLGVVFLLNSVALLCFPYIGHYLGLSQHSFGLWCALAIHDTSSVLGATSHYGSDALDIGMAMKLTRALWIIPVSLGVAAIETRRRQKTAVETPRFPKFILGFVMMVAVATWCPSIHPVTEIVSGMAHRLIAVTLFLVGASITPAMLRSVHWRSLIFALLIWVGISTITLIIVISS